MEVAIYQYPSGNYWNGSAFVPGFRTVPATLYEPGAESTPFSTTFTPPAPGYYLVGVLPIDANYNYSLTPFNTFLAS